jgi:hypothetical protein
MVALTAFQSIGFSTSVSAAPLTNTFTYQGLLSLDGEVQDGEFDFFFRLYNDEVAGALTASEAFDDIGVVDGLFAVDLDFSGVTFTNEKLWLQIEVRPAAGGAWTILTPRQAINAVPFARFATNGPATDGVTLDEAYDSGGPGAGRTINADSGAVHISGSNGLTVSGDVGIGTTSPFFDLDVHRLGSIGIGSAPTTIGAKWEQAVIGGGGLTEWCYLSVGGSGLMEAPSGPRLIRAADRALHFSVQEEMGVGLAESQMVLTQDGDVGIGTNFPEGRLAIEDEQAIVRLTTTTSTGGSKLQLKKEGPGGLFGTTYGALEFLDSADTVRGGMFYSVHPFGSNGVNLTAGGATRMVVADDGNIGIGTGAPKQRLHVNGDYYGLGHLWLHAFEGDGNSGTAYIQARDDSGSSSVSMQFRTQNAGNYAEVMRLTNTGRVGIGTTNPAQRLHVVGTARVDVLQIAGGADLSENFVVNDKPEPGTVVEIDPSKAGELRVATGAYNRRVAGIVSGAGGISTGMLMGQEGSIADGDHPIALTGRVYCKCDSTNGAIQPGDLLTTSDIPGHAMKVLDHDQAQGAIIGKAMTSLESGTGLVLVLVSLQ